MPENRLQRTREAYEKKYFLTVWNTETRETHTFTFRTWQSRYNAAYICQQNGDVIARKWEE